MNGSGSGSRKSEFEKPDPTFRYMQGFKKTNITQISTDYVGFFYLDRRIEKISASESFNNF